VCELKEFSDKEAVRVGYIERSRVHLFIYIIVDASRGLRSKVDCNVVFVTSTRVVLVATMVAQRQGYSAVKVV
jgi:uncharacterized protein (DUF58 family)